MNNDSSKTNILELITEHVNGPNHIRSGSAADASSSCNNKRDDDEMAKAKAKAANPYPDAKTTTTSKKSATVVDVDVVSAEVDVDNLHAVAVPLTEAEKRKQRRRRSQYRVSRSQRLKQQPTKPQQEDDTDYRRRVQRVKSLPMRNNPSDDDDDNNDHDKKNMKKVSRSYTGPIQPRRPRVGCTVAIEMGDGSNDGSVDILRVVAERASLQQQLEGPDSSSAADDNDKPYDEEEEGVAGCHTIAKAAATKPPPPKAAAMMKDYSDTKVMMKDLSGKASLTGLTIMKDTSGKSLMKDISGLSLMRDTSATSLNHADLKASRTTGPRGTRVQSGARMVGAYSAAPGQGYVRTEHFQAEALLMQQQHPTPLEEDYSGTSTQEEATVVVGQEQARRSRRQSGMSQSSKSQQQVFTLSAVRVDEDDLEQNIRDQITSTAAQAHVVDLEKETEDLVKTHMEKVQRKYIGVGMLLLIFLAVIVTAIVLAVTKKGNSNDSSSASHHPLASNGEAHVEPATLHSVSKRGTLRCGLSKRDEDANFHPVYEKMWKGFNGDFCKAIAAATLDGDVNVTIQTVTEAERWEALQNGTLDVLIVGCPHIRESLHFDLDSEVAATFSTPFLFDGVGIGGMPEYVENCATTKGFENYLGCRDVKVCAVQGSHALDVFQDILHPSQIVEVPSFHDLYNRFAQGCCNMLTTDWSNERAEVTVRKESGYEGPYALGEALYSKQPYGVATRKLPKEKHHNATTDDERERDPQVWSEWVDWVIQALIAAEQSNITQSTANYITQTDVFGEKYRNGFAHAVAAVGNYAEIYERNMGQVVPRDGMNLLNDGSTGLHYHRSIGDVTEYGTVDEHGTLAAVKERGKLICGIPVMQNTNFTLDVGEEATHPPARFLEDDHTYANDLGGASIDIEFCRALASSVFQGLHTSSNVADSCLASASPSNETEVETGENPMLQFVLLADPSEGYTKLHNAEIDVIAGYRMDLQGDVKEPTTGVGYSFSQPYLYGPTSGDEHVTTNNRCLVTRQYDQQWSDFVHLVVMSIFYAEEHHIAQNKANAMPVVNLFGPAFKRMFRDAVFAIGNYGEVYERVVEQFLPRAGGPNTLNAEADPQLCSMPGLI